MAGGNRHTQFPASPTRLLATMDTDTQIAQLFATAHHRAQAYNTINHWVTIGAEALACRASSISAKRGDLRNDMYLPC